MIQSAIEWQSEINFVPNTFCHDEKMKCTLHLGDDATLPNNMLSALFTTLISTRREVSDRQTGSTTQSCTCENIKNARVSDRETHISSQKRVPRHETSTNLLSIEREAKNYDDIQKSMRWQMCHRQQVN